VKPIPHRPAVSRRGFIHAALAAASGTLLGGVSPQAAQAPVRAGLCDGSRDLQLVNGHVLTFDANNRVASSVAIRDGRIVAVGDRVNLGPCARRIDLKGATVIPGLIDSHVHFIRDGLNPGHEVRAIELATSISEMQRMISARIEELGVPVGEFVTCVGGWNANGLVEKRMPSLTEVDAAAPRHPVYLSTTGLGGAVTNTLGKAFFESKGVTVDAATGALNAGMAFAALRNAQNAGDHSVSSWRRGTEEAIAFASSLGMTMAHDVGGNGNLFVDLTAYNEVLALWREGKLNIRIRSFLYSDTDTGYGIAKARMDNQLNRIGDDVFRHLGVGERVNVSTTDPGFIQHCEYAAAHSWTVQQHSSTQEEISLHVRAFQAANAVRPIKDLRWSLTHVNTVTAAQLDALIAMGTGVTVQGTPYTGGNGGAPFRLIGDKMGAARIPVGGGSDATNVAALNPWLMMSFMCTGRNNAGAVINAGGAQNCSRLEALRMYTIGSAYFSFDDDKLGSIEPGKLADLAVLSDDPLTVTDAKFKTLRAVMTLQGGRIVHGGPA
jgi:predicted amidohydrolase YtcJ